MAIPRNHVLQRVREYVAEQNPVPPLSLKELKRHADAMVALLGCDPVYRDYSGILNEPACPRSPPLQVKSGLFRLSL